ncbi:MAG TPA: hypothetical protein VGO69_06030 [Pyrinomonadaceae bacterium]|nr:hypothetical protein [Pyrinomonadaceae bacterium]
MQREGTTSKEPVQASSIKVIKDESPSRKVMNVGLVTSDEI